MLGAQKFASDTEVQSVVPIVSGLDSSQHRSLHRAFRIWDRWDKCLNELGRYVEK